MNMNHMTMKKGKRGKMSKGGMHTEMPKAPPGMPGTPMVSQHMPMGGEKLGKDMKSGKNRDRKSFSGGHQW